MSATTLLSQLRSLGDEGFPVCWRAADALEKQAAEIAQLKWDGQSFATCLAQQATELESLKRDIESLLPDLTAANVQIEQQAAQIEALRADAERWRFFLSTRPPNTHEVVCAAIDAGIDAALRQEQPKGEGA